MISHFASNFGTTPTGIEEVIALASDFASAESVKRRPGKLITLRQKARVIKKSK